MRYKSEAFGRFKEYRLEVENQTGHGIISQWTPPGTPQLNGTTERRNRTLLDIVRSMMSFAKLPLSFWGYALETAAKLLNMALSKTVPQTPYKIWHGKLASYKYLRVWGSPAYVKRLVGDKLDSRSSLCRIFLWITDEMRCYLRNQVNYLNKTTRHHLILRFPLMSIGQRSKDIRRSDMDIDSDKWLEAIKSEMDSMGSNQVWSLVDPSKGVKPVGCKWVYKRKLGVNGEVMAFKAKLVVKGYTQRAGVDLREPSRQ
ncbi:Retrovirus-related Pol polyprotein from transposon TNT 1-94 [Sesamum angolense]|uniref:Retrovirus-related Pol polyprotein from transposon TNT 1-94 n=1 Tax=Sesamum angolense TaxID=2727404 RepID=A0AAE1T4A3_9LAMI|nr:Retrovirus-related Pol polyprotein from transposon TNT 1-94 [Sesamum angolense]